MWNWLRTVSPLPQRRAIVRCETRLIQMFWKVDLLCNNASAATSNKMKVAAPSKKEAGF